MNRYNERNRTKKMPNLIKKLRQLIKAAATKPLI
jgi:hypothetical protein